MEQMRKDLDEIMTAVRSLDGAMHYMSQRVAWNEICFKKVQDSGSSSDGAPPPVLSKPSMRR